jgi:hypothetical protein
MESPSPTITLQPTPAPTSVAPSVSAAPTREAMSSCAEVGEAAGARRA